MVPAMGKAPEGPTRIHHSAIQGNCFDHASLELFFEGSFQSRSILVSPQGMLTEGDDQGNQNCCQLKFLSPFSFRSPIEINFGVIGLIVLSMNTVGLAQSGSITVQGEILQLHHHHLLHPDRCTSNLKGHHPMLRHTAIEPGISTVTTLGEPRPWTLYPALCARDLCKSGIKCNCPEIKEKTHCYQWVV